MGVISPVLKASCEGAELGVFRAFVPAASYFIRLTLPCFLVSCWVLFQDLFAFALIGMCCSKRFQDSR